MLYSYHNSVVLVILSSFLVLGIGISFEEDVSLNLQQKKLLDKFKERVIDKLPEEYMRKEIYLIKWLRTSGFDVDYAESRILRDVKWRKEQKMDTIHEEDWSDMWNSDFRYYLDGRDKMGRSFMFVDIRNIDLRQFIIQGNEQRLLRYVDMAYDDACRLIRNLGEKYGNMTRGHLIVDLGGFNLVQHGCIRCMPFLIRILFSYLDHWPECQDKIIFLNTPSSIQQVVEILRPLITDPVLNNSIYFYGTNRKQWTKALEEDFDFDQLPPSIGGTKIYKGMDDYDTSR